MTDSLVIAGHIELLGGGVISALPECAGASFLLVPGYDLGENQAIVSLTESLLTDGEIPEGRGSSNRTISLPVKITAPSRDLLTAAREVLMRAVDGERWQLTWTRDGNTLPVVFDCYRAQAAVTYDLDIEQQLICWVDLTFPAAPFGRSDVPVTVEFPSPLTGHTAPAAPVNIDLFGSVSGSQWTQSTVGPGPHSARWNPASAPANNPTGVGLTASYTKSGLSLNLTGLSAVTFWAGFGSTSYFHNWCRLGGAVTFTLTLTDSGARTLSFHRVQKAVKGSNAGGSPLWTKIRMVLPASATFDFAHVSAYTLTARNTSADMRYSDFWVDSVIAVPAASGLLSPVRGWVYDLAGIIGTARAPASWQFQSAMSPVLVTKVFSDARHVPVAVPLRRHVRGGVRHRRGRRRVSRRVRRRRRRRRHGG